MNSSQPTPIYLLLTNPAWGGNKDFEQVMRGLDGAWEFDANETSADRPLMGEVINRWMLLELPEEGLIDVIERLVKRGASASAALEYANTHDNRWKSYRAVQRMLQELSAGKELGSVSLGAKLLDIASQGLNVQDANSEIVALLDQHQGWDTKIDGLRVLPWMAINCCQEGQMQGWTTPRWSTADSNIRKMRLLRNLALSSKVANYTDAVDRLLTGCGMLMLSSYYRSHGGEVDAGDTLCKAAGKVLGGDENEIIETLEKAVSSGDLDLDARVKLGMSVILGLVEFIEDPQLSWKALTLAIPLAYENDRFLGSDKTFAKVLQVDKDLPDSQFWQSLPHDAIHHDAMLRVLLCSFQNYHNDTSKFRTEFFDLTKQWASLAPLPELDMEQCKTWAANGHGYRNNFEFQRQLDEYQEIIRCSWQGNSLQSSTPQVNPKVRRSRL